MLLTCGAFALYLAFAGRSGSRKAGAKRRPGSPRHGGSRRPPSDSSSGAVQYLPCWSTCRFPRALAERGWGACDQLIDADRGASEHVSSLSSAASSRDTGGRNGIPLPQRIPRRRNASASVTRVCRRRDEEGVPAVSGSACWWFRYCGRSGGSRRSTTSSTPWCRARSSSGAEHDAHGRRPRDKPSLTRARARSAALVRRSHPRISGRMGRGRAGLIAPAGHFGRPSPRWRKRLPRVPVDRESLIDANRGALRSAAFAALLFLGACRPAADPPVSRTHRRARAGVGAGRGDRARSVVGRAQVLDLLAECQRAVRQATRRSSTSRRRSRVESWSRRRRRRALCRAIPRTAVMPSWCTGFASWKATTATRSDVTGGLRAESGRGLR
jgi:hypothetical protein